jgi:hypothetical protein
MRNDIIRNNDFLRQLELKTTHLRENIPISGEFLTRKNARNLLAIRGRMAVSVEKFYYLRHRRRLQYPYLPCVAVRGGQGHLSFYPMEVIIVLKDQVIDFLINFKNNLSCLGKWKHKPPIPKRHK